MKIHRGLGRDYWLFWFASSLGMGASNITINPCVFKVFCCFFEKASDLLPLSVRAPNRRQYLFL